MAHVITDTGHDLGDVTDPGALAYYRREPGFSVDGVEVPQPEPAPVVEVVEDLPVSDAPPRPAEDDHKPEWVAYAKAVDPDNAETIDGLTKAELVETYGGQPAE